MSCSHNELLVFRALGVFAGPAPAAAVASVCGLEEWEAHDLLGLLVERSLATARADEQGITRFGTLFTLRRAAQRMLQDSDDEHGLLLAHARWVVRAGRAAQEVGGVARLEGEPLVPDMLLALERADKAGLGLDETADLARNRILRLGSRVPELAWRLIDDILARVDAPDLARSHAYALACSSDDLDPNADRFAARLEEGVAAARQARDDDDLLIILLEQAAGGDGIAAATGEVTPAEWAALTEAQQIQRRMGLRGRMWASMVQNVAGILHERAGDLEAARQSYLMAMREAERLGDTHEVAREVFNLADLDLTSGQYGAAAKGFDDAARSYADLEDHLMHAYACWQGASAYTELGDLVLAGDAAADSVLAARRTGSRKVLAMMLIRAAEIAVAAGEVMAARAFSDEALSIAPDGDLASEAWAIVRSLQR